MVYRFTTSEVSRVFMLRGRTSDVGVFSNSMFVFAL